MSTRHPASADHPLQPGQKVRLRPEHAHRLQIGRAYSLLDINPEPVTPPVSARLIVTGCGTYNDEHPRAGTHFAYVSWYENPGAGTGHIEVSWLEDTLARLHGVRQLDEIIERMANGGQPTADDLYWIARLLQEVIDR